MNQYDDEEDILWRWKCPICNITIRTRYSSNTAQVGRWHSYTEHREAPRLLIPVMCMWDPRIKGQSALFTYDS